MYKILHIPTALPVYDYPDYLYDNDLMKGLVSPTYNVRDGRYLEAQLLVFSSVESAHNYITNFLVYRIDSDAGYIMMLPDPNALYYPKTNLDIFAVVDHV